MEATLIAHTVVMWEKIVESTKGDYRPLPEVVRASDDLAEFAGRVCYQSFDRPNPKTRKNADYLANIVDQGHESVFGHASATFYITGVSRSLTHELIRHRWLTFSELSQRYVNMDYAEMVIPPAMEGDADCQGELDAVFSDTVTNYGYLVDRLIGSGLSRKQAREAARAVLPSMIETRIVVSGNMRAWRDFLKQRLSLAADAEIRLLAIKIAQQLYQIAPNTFRDIMDEFEVEILP